MRGTVVYFHSRDALRLAGALVPKVLAGDLLPTLQLKVPGRDAAENSLGVWVTRLVELSIPPDGTGIPMAF